MKKLDLRAWAPPGFPYRTELGVFFWGLGLSFLYSLWFFADFFQELELFLASARKSSVLCYFYDLEYFLDHTKPWLGYMILALVMVGCMVWNYGYHRQDSKSVYLMRRLPDPREYHRRCLAIPLVCTVLTLLLCFITLALCCLVYKTCAPDVPYKMPT